MYIEFLTTLPCRVDSVQVYSLHMKGTVLLYVLGPPQYSDRDSTHVQCTMYSVQCTLYSVQCTVFSVHYTVYTIQPPPVYFVAVRTMSSGA